MNDFKLMINKNLVLGNISDINIHEKVESLLKDQQLTDWDD